MGKNSFVNFFFGRKFFWEFFLWKKIPVDMSSLDKSSYWKFFFGKKFLLTCLLWIKVPTENSSLEKNSWWNRKFPFSVWKSNLKNKFGNRFLNYTTVWKNFLHLKKELGKISQFQNFFGNNFFGKKYSWKRIQLDIFSHFWKKSPLVKISLVKNSTGNNFCWEKFHWKKIPVFSKFWTKMYWKKIMLGKNS